MNTHFKKIGGLFAACLFASSVQATVLLQENFTYTNGNLLTVAGGNWTVIGTAGTLPAQVSSATVTFTNLSSGTSGEDYKRDIPGMPYTSGVLYMSALVAISNAPTGANGDYFLALYSTNSSGGGYSTRIFASTITGGGWSFGNTNNGSAPVDDATARSVATWYKLIVKYDCTAKSSAFGVFAANYVPADDSELNVVPSGTGAGPNNVTSVAIRQGSTSGSAWKGAMDYILVGTTLADVASNAPVTPVIASQPQDTAGSVGHNAVSFSTVAVGEAGDAPLSYKWYYNTNTPLTEDPLHFIGTASGVLVVTNLVLGDSGTYSCVVTNASGTNVTRYALLSVSLAPIPPTIDSDISPIGSTNTVGDSVGFGVTAHGVPAVAYQWKWIPDTNTLVTNIIAGANSASLSLTNLTTDQSGRYFVTITNTTAYYTTNSAQAVLKVNPAPLLTIAQLQAVTNTTAYYTIQGTVTTWTNLTTSAAPQFFMQDSTAGIMVYWNNAGGSNCPPAGAVVRVTGPLAPYQGNLEIKPDYNSPVTGVGGGVQVISTGGPLPVPQPLPFDPNITGNPATMKMLEGTYFVASNVMLTAGATFVSANESLTNNAYRIKTAGMYGLKFTNDVGQTFTIFINNYVGIVGQAKPAGPVTVYGVLQEYFGTYELIPTRYADIISYISTTNVMTNARKGDAPVNNYSENVLRPGETLTASVSIADPEGGNVTLTPVTAGLPASASWTVLNNGAVAHAVFKFTPTIADSASNYVAAVNVSSTSGNNFVNSETVYVPDTNEQMMAISEFLANPTTNTGAAHFNPLNRATDTTNIITDDQYIEVANQSVADLAVGWTLDYGNRSKPLLDSAAVGGGLALPASGSLVVYSGPGSDNPNLSTPSALATAALGLRTGSSSGLLILRNANGNIVDRVAYSGSDENTNGSLSRFPTLNDAFVPQAYVGVSPVTPGYQYDGARWSSSSQIPAGVASVNIAVTNKQAVFTFPVTGNTQVYTLWSATDITGSFKILSGQPLSGVSGSMTVTNLPANQQFYYLSTQTNGTPPPSGT